MKVLVTGGLGFIGSNICERLVRDGHEVIALDNMHTGREENVESIKGKIRIVNKNSGEIASLNEKFDAILHQGVYSSSPMYKQNPLLTAKVLEEWISILEFVKKNPCKLVWASSSSVYNGHAPLHREDMDIKITDFYTEGRYAMERIAKLYSDFYGVNSVGLRYFSVYGPHESSKGKFANLVTQFLWDIKAGRQPVILGDGKQSRDFVFVQDVVEANMKALDFKGTDVFNVGTGKTTPLNEVVALLNEKLDKEVEAKYEENKIKNYVAVTQADVSKAERMLGFKAQIPLENGIDLLIKSYQA